MNKEKKSAGEKMNSYTIKFELFGKKMQLTDVIAKTEREAMEYVRNKVIIHSIEENVTEKELYKDFINFFENIFKTK